MPTLNDIRTPALILDKGVLSRNLRRVSEKASRAGVRLRPHLKTAKSAEIARLATEKHFGGVTVSTLEEASYFSAHGINDITYAVCISPDKIDEVLEMRRSGVDVHVITDDAGVARILSRKASDAGKSLSVYVELDTGYTRSGVLPNSDALIEIARVLSDGESVDFRGVLTHAGHSYDAGSVPGIREIAEEERAGAVQAAERIRKAGFDCPEVSIGSTPTVLLGESLEGVTEVRPGNYMFLDLAMYARGVCAIEDLALSVLTTVIVTHPDRSRVLVDAGALALSKDTGASGHDSGYGLLRSVELGDIPGADESYIVDRLCQEQGWIGGMNGKPIDVSTFAIGDRLRILPNHACMTAAAYDKYVVVDGGVEIIDEWGRCNGW